MAAVSVEVVVAATDCDLNDAGTDGGIALGSITLAALALPGLLGTAHAESAPTDGVVSVKLQSLKTGAGLERIRVIAPAVCAGAGRVQLGAGSQPGA